MQHKHGIQLLWWLLLYQVIPIYNLQFQYFWDFNKYFQAIFSQLSFGNFWLYVLGEVAI